MCADGNPAIEYLFRVKLCLFRPRCDFSFQPRPRLNCSRTSRKRLPKMHRLIGRLPEVVVYKNRSIGASSEKRSRHINFMVDDLLQRCLLSYDMSSSMLSLKVFVYSQQHSAHSEHNHEFIIIIFYLMVSVITMCNLIKRLIRATFLSTPASDVHER